MSFLRHEQIYQSDGVLFCAWGEAFAGSAPSLIVLMSLQPAIPRRVALCIARFRFTGRLP